jgi:hypothetical protein
LEAHLHPHSEKVLIDETNSYAYFEKRLCKFVEDETEDAFSTVDTCTTCAFSKYCSEAVHSVETTTYCSPSLNNKNKLWGSWKEIPIKVLKYKPKDPDPQTDLEKEIVSQIL